LLYHSLCLYIWSLCAFSILLFPHFLPPLCFLHSSSSIESGSSSGYGFMFIRFCCFFIALHVPFLCVFFVVFVAVFTFSASSSSVSWGLFLIKHKGLILVYNSFACGCLVWLSLFFVVLVLCFCSDPFFHFLLQDFFWSAYKVCVLFVPSLHVVFMLDCFNFSLFLCSVFVIKPFSSSSLCFFKFPTVLSFDSDACFFLMLCFWFFVKFF